LKLIDQLGDDREDVKSSAEKKLAALGEDVLPALRRASKDHPDADARLAALLLVAAIEKDVFREIRRFGKGETADSLAASPDGKRIASGSFAGGAVRVWDVKTGKLVHSLEGHEKGVRVAWSADGETIVTIDSYGWLRLWDARTGKLTKKINAGSGTSYGVALTPDGKKAVTGADRDDTVRVWDLAAGKKLAGNRDGASVVYLLAMMPDGKQVVAGSFGGEVWLIDVETAKRVRKMEQGRRSTSSLAVSPSGRLIAGGQYRGAVWLWEASTGKLVKELKGHTDVVRQVAFSSDGERLVSAGDRAVIVWRVADGKVIDKVSHDGEARCAVFLPDGDHVVTSGEDKTLRLWRVRR
jgi:WD40 repeat protein